jgi:hypothetical protein
MFVGWIIMWHNYVAVAQFVEALRYKPEVRGFDFQWYYWNISCIQSFRKHYVLGFDSASNRNEY